MRFWRITDSLRRLSASRVGRHSSMIGIVAAAVLIVDDTARFRARARRWLEALGYVVVAEATDGGSVLAAVREHRPDVVLLDVQLPDISGVSVADRLADVPDPPAVVLTSTHEAADFGDLAARCGARGFVSKAELSGEVLADLLG